MWQESHLNASQLVFYRPRMKYEGRLCFDTCLSIILSVHGGGGGGYLSQVQPGGVPKQGPAGGEGGTQARSSQGGYPSQVQLEGVPLTGGPHLGNPHQTRLGGTPAGVGGYPTSAQRWSTLYAAVGMPLAFTQEDFLVVLIISQVKLLGAILLHWNTPNKGLFTLTAATATETQIFFPSRMGYIGPYGSVHMETCGKGNGNP